MQNSESLTQLARLTLATGDDALCFDCAGRGRNLGRTCPMCNGKGAVCPACHGMRFLHMRRRHHQPWEADIERCQVCCEGNNVNEALELRAIRDYIARSDAITGPTLVRDAGEK